MKGRELRAVLAANIRRMRDARGWSQERLAEEAGLHRTYVGSIERKERNVSIDNIGALSRSLGVEGWELLLPPKAPRR